MRVLRRSAGLQVAAQFCAIQSCKDRRLAQHALALSQLGIAFLGYRNTFCLGRFYELCALPVARLLRRVVDNKFKETTTHRFRGRLDWLDGLAAGQFFTKNVIVALASTVQFGKPCQTAGGQKDAVQVRPILDPEAQEVSVKGVVCLAALQPPVMA